jgi:hypothetical protein
LREVGYGTHIHLIAHTDFAPEGPVQMEGFFKYGHIYYFELEATPGWGPAMLVNKKKHTTHEQAIQAVCGGVKVQTPRHITTAGAYYTSKAARIYMHLIAPILFHKNNLTWAASLYLSGFWVCT